METVQRRLVPLLCTSSEQGTCFLAIANEADVSVIPSAAVDRSTTPALILEETKKLFGAHVPIRLIPHTEMASVIVETVQGYTKMYFPLSDARIPQEAVSMLVQSGIRWCHMDLVRERNQQELDHIKVVPGISSLILLNINEKLLPAENLHSSFLAGKLTEEWRSSSKETKLNEEKLKEFAQWWEGPQIWAPAQGSRGGMGILLHRDLQVQVIDSEADLWGRWAWMKVGIGNEEWALMTVYAPTAPGERVKFFSRLMQRVLRVERLMMAGDWNVSLDEALRLAAPSANRNDVRSLLDFSTELALYDPYPVLNPGEAGYTWFSHPNRDRQIVTRRRLDYFLVVDQVLDRVTSIREASQTLSDHKPVVDEIRLHLGMERGKGFFRLNSQVLQVPRVSEWVADHMTKCENARPHFDSTADWLDGGIAITSRVLDAVSRILARERNKKEAESKRRVEEAEERMEGHPISAMVWAAERVKRLEEWDNFQIDKQRWWINLLQDKGIVTHDKMTKETFQKLLPSRAQHQMVELKHPFNEPAPTACSTAGMLQYARLYYEDVLSTRRPQDGVDSDLSTSSDMWDSTAVQLCTTARLDLDRPLSLEEVTQTLKTMARGKSPGVDGLTVEFYAANWGAFGESLVTLYNEVTIGGKLGTGMTHGVISVLFKKGDKAEVRNWRPISLLNVSYKILAKSLARRLSKHLPDLVEKDQGAFVQGRSIFNNIVTAIEALEIVQSENPEMAVLLLDLEKAYDKVGWAFVLTTLRRMGFGRNSCAWIIAMYTFSTSAVMINGHLSTPFALTRSLRQGCPLAPLVFILQLEVLLNKIRKNRVIKGLRLHNGEECKVKALADDLFVLSENSKDSLSTLKNILREYSSLSEATVNWNKSTYLLPADFRLEVEWGMRRVENGEEERFLGVLISLQVGASAQGLLLQQRISSRLRLWGVAWHLSIIGRALVTNVALYSILWFVSAVREIAVGVLKVIRRLVARFIWKPRAKQDDSFISKVALDTLSFPRAEGGLGLMDPARRNQAQLRGWVAKVATVGPSEHWVLLAERILAEEWELARPKDAWACLFMPSFRKRKLKSCFWEAIRKAWNRMPPDVQQPPSTKEEILLQLLFDNPEIRNQNGVPFKADGSAGSFGQSWVKRGVVRIEDLWSTLTGRWKPLSELKLVLRSLQQVESHWRSILEAIPREWQLLLGPEGLDPPGTWYVPNPDSNNNTVWKVIEILPSGFRRVEKWVCKDTSNILSRVEEETVRGWDNPPQARVVETKCREPAGFGAGLCAHFQLVCSSPLSQDP
ncbi:hypothetical protein CBR_g45317 [Chara braunii]|uniref:Reverse transcriptase domain-containing protein n=1 Tax=Chara braunii TaxID=69332 RepID=A0A388LY64_CHABU|nr:hypothetical protein CBR_g45317 [Chara braunii]|eukprot:GBG87257.1 hypothetical protein CBR_g45317 [Chara braunii]